MRIIALALLAAAAAVRSETLPPEKAATVAAQALAAGQTAAQENIRKFKTSRVKKDRSGVYISTTLTSSLLGGTFTLRKFGGEFLMSAAHQGNVPIQPLLYQTGYYQIRGEPVVSALLKERPAGDYAELSGRGTMRVSFGSGNRHIPCVYDIAVKIVLQRNGDLDREEARVTLELPASIGLEDEKPYYDPNAVPRCVSAGVETEFYESRYILLKRPD